MRKLAFSIIALLVAIVALVDCDQAQPLVYPSNWPEPRPLAPPGSTRALLIILNDSYEIAGAPADLASGGEGKVWIIGYASKLDWTDNKQYLENQLRPLLYRRVRDETLKTKFYHSRVIEYVDPLGQTMVQLMCDNHTYDLTIWVWDGKPYVADYNEGTSL